MKKKQKSNKKKTSLNIKPLFAAKKQKRGGFRSLLSKILVNIGVPVVVSYVVVGAVVLNISSASITDLTNKELIAKSQTAAYQTDQYFTKYLETATQIAVGGQTESLCSSTYQGETFISSTSFSMAQQTLRNVYQLDREIIVSTWVADVDSEQIVRSVGYRPSEKYIMKDATWYSELMEKNGAIMSEPYVDENRGDGELVVSVVAPVNRYGTSEIIGVSGVDFTLRGLRDLMDSYVLGDTGFFILASGEGRVIYHPNKEFYDQAIFDIDISENVKKAITDKYEGLLEYESEGTRAHGYVVPVGETGWYVITGIPKAEFLSTSFRITTTMIITFAIAVVVIFAMIMFVSRGIVSPLKKLKDTAQKISQGDLNVQVDVNSNDEVGQVGEAITGTVKMLHNYIDYIKEITSVLGTMANGDLRIKLEQEYTGEFSAIKDALINISHSLSRTIAHIQRSAEQVDSGATQIASSSQALASGAAQQAGSIQELSDSIMNVSDKADDNLNNVVEATESVELTEKKVVESNEHMKNMTTAMKRISDSSNEISKIISTIDNIAFQTNILALNATIEAARAGMAGKGFAVVADEVRNLAVKSAEAARQTADMIRASIESVQEGSEITDTTASALKEAAEHSVQVRNIIERIKDGSQEQTEAITQIKRGIEQISAVVQNNAATAEESSASSEELSAQSVLMREATNQFKIVDTELDFDVSTGFSTNEDINLTVEIESETEEIKEDHAKNNGITLSYISEEDKTKEDIHDKY